MAVEQREGTPRAGRAPGRAHRVGRGLVLLDERRGRYWHLNRSGATTLRLLLDGRSPDQVADALVARFPAAAATAAGDVTRLIDSLRAAGMVYPS